MCLCACACACACDWGGAYPYARPLCLPSRHRSTPPFSATNRAAMYVLLTARRPLPTPCRSK